MRKWGLLISPSHAPAAHPQLLVTFVHACMVHDDCGPAALPPGRLPACKSTAPAASSSLYRQDALGLMPFTCSKQMQAGGPCPNGSGLVQRSRIRDGSAGRKQAPRLSPWPNPVQRTLLTRHGLQSQHEHQMRCALGPVRSRPTPRRCCKHSALLTKHEDNTTQADCPLGLEMVGLCRCWG